MKHLSSIRFVSIASLLGVVALAGCAGNDAFQFPDTPAEVHPGEIHGSVFGGHAPIVGAHVYVMEAGHTGTGAGQYASAAANRMTTGAYGSDTHGNFVLTDNKGGFNITGDYSCDAGVPVYIAATGGADDGSQNITITQVIFYGSVFGYSFIEFLGTNTVTAGQLVTFAGLTNNYAFLNNTTQTVFGTVTGGFFIAIPEIATVNGSATGTATPDVNPAITNMAMLGLCPTPPTTFANTLNFIYMNEVSTAALAYAMGGFGIGPFNVGAPNTNVIGLENAALNANQLYDIQGGNNANTPDGEGHIARTTTPGGNGVVPQALMDTLGNILAACVDSENSSNSSSNPGASGASVNCTQLFTYATSNGVPYGNTGAGTIATDTATAAFNIAHYPAGAAAYSSGSTGFVQKIFALQGSETMPFNPGLTTAPNDFSVAIKYTDPSGQNLFLASPSGIALDSAGNAIVATAGAGDKGGLADLGTTGQIIGEAYEAGIQGSGIAIGPSTTRYIWTANTQDNTVANPDTAGAFYISAEPVTSTGDGNTSSERAYTDTTGTGGFYLALPTAVTQTQGVAISGGGVAYIADTAANAVHRIPTPSTLPPPSSGSSPATSVTSTKLTLAGCTTGATGLAVDNAAAGYNVWAISAPNNTVCKFTGTGTLINVATGLATPQGIAIDNYGNAWITDNASGSNVVEVVAMPTGGSTRYEVFQAGAGGLNRPYGIAFDGANNMWVANQGNNSVTELTNPLSAALGNVQGGATIANVSPSTGYQPVSTSGVYQIANPTAVAVDISGDVWVTNTAANTVSEIIGSATPVVGSIALGAENNKLATRP